MANEQSMLTPEILSYIGMTGVANVSPEAVEAGAVRRFAQATMDNDPAYLDGTEGHPHAPLLFPINMFQRPLGAADALGERADDPHFDGLVLEDNTGLPELPLHGMALLNGGAEVEFYRYPHVGEFIERQSTYVDIYEKSSSNGNMIFVVTETVYRTAQGEIIMKFRQIDIRR